MKTTLIVKPYVWENIPGYIVLFVYQFDPDNPARQGSSIAHFKQQFGATQKEMEDPYTHGKYVFDLTPWLHLPEETHLQLRWGFVPDHPIPPGDPRYPFADASSITRKHRVLLGIVVDASYVIYSGYGSDRKE